MIGIVVVSHSHALAKAAIGLATEMVPADRAPTVLSAAGLDEVTFGTDAAAIAAALEEADSGDGVLVLLDLGSAVLSAEMALEFIDPDVAERVRLSPAPLVEGLVAAVVTAATGASLDACATEAERGLAAKGEHLGGDPDGDAGTGVEPSESVAGDSHTLAVTVDLPHGLHARPAAAVVAALAGIGAEVTARNATLDGEPSDARSVTGLGGLNLRRGDVLELVASGAEAAAAVAALAALVGERFGEAEESEATAAPTGGPVEVIGTAHVLPEAPDLTGYVPGDDEAARLASARTTVRDFLVGLPDADAQGFLAAWVALLDDKAFLPAGFTAVDQGATAPEGVAVAVEKAAARFAKLTDPYLKARAEDIRGLGRLVLAALADAALLPAWPRDPFVAVAAELDLVTCLSLDPGLCVGVVTWAGSGLGHGAILARQRGIPYLPDADWAVGVLDGADVQFTVG